MISSQDKGRAPPSDASGHQKDSTERYGDPQFRLTDPEAMVCSLGSTVDLYLDLDLLLFRHPYYDPYPDRSSVPRVENGNPDPKEQTSTPCHPS